MSSTPKRVRKLPKKLVKEVNEPDDLGPMVAASDSSPSTKPTPTKPTKISPTKLSPSPSKKQKKEDTLPDTPLPIPGVVAKAKKVAGQPVAPPPPAVVIEDMQEVMRMHLKKVSGEGREEKIHMKEHSYCRPWNQHPDPSMKCRPAKYLFMKDFPKHVIRTQQGHLTGSLQSHLPGNLPLPFRLENEVVDVESVQPVPEDPLVRECEKVIMVC